MADNGGARRRTGLRWLWIVAGIAGMGAVCAAVGIWHLPARMYPAGGDADARAALQGGLLTAAALTAVAGGLTALDETRRANAEVRRANENTHVRELYATTPAIPTRRSPSRPAQTRLCNDPGCCPWLEQHSSQAVRTIPATRLSVGCRAGENQRKSPPKTGGEMRWEVPSRRQQCGQEMKGQQ